MSATDYACHFASRILCVIITILLPFHPHTNTQIPILILYGAHAGHVHTDPEFSVFFRLLISYLMCFKTRCFFYVSWLLGDSVSNAAGLGFNGYDKEGSARWDLVSVGRYRDIELRHSTLHNPLIQRWKMAIHLQRKIQTRESRLATRPSIKI